MEQSGSRIEMCSQSWIGISQSQTRYTITKKRRESRGWMYGEPEVEGSGEEQIVSD
jgi:hypothetical protein